MVADHNNQPLPAEELPAVLERAKKAFRRVQSGAGEEAQLAELKEAVDELALGTPPTYDREALDFLIESACTARAQAKPFTAHQKVRCIH